MAKKTGSLDWLTIGEAAKYLGVSKDTLRRWEKRGKIKSYRTPGGRRRYTMYDLELAMKPQKTTPLITHRPPEEKPQITKAKEEPVVKPTPTPEPAPKVVRPIKRFSTLIILLLIAIFTLFVLFALSGGGRFISSYLESSRELLNPTPKTYSP